MITRKIKVGITLLLAVGVLTGCGQQRQTKHSKTNNTSSKKTSIQKKTTKKIKSPKKEKQTATPWNSDKDKQLETFINQWAPTMGQSYTKYDGSTPLKTSVGETYPDALSQTTVLGESGTVGWSKDGNGNFDYNVVAIYNYDGTRPPFPNRITYAFAFHHGQPIALVDQTRDGSPVLKETQNADVKAAFAKIAGGTAKPTTDSPNNSKDEFLSEKVIGLLAKLETGDDATKEPELGITQDENGRYYITTGTSAGTVAFTYTKTTVTYGVHDVSEPGSTDSDGKFYANTVSLQSLKDKYYSTPEQKRSIQDAAARVKWYSNK